MEVINKLLDLLSKLLPAITGWFIAKQDSKIEVLKEENETLIKYNEIDSKPTTSDDAYAGLLK